MPLASGARLAPNFTAAELNADDPAIPDTALQNLYGTADWLQQARGVLGVPLVVHSGYRTSAENAAVGGSPTSDHPNGLAADFTPEGVGLTASYRELYAARSTGALPPFDQLIFYPVDGHIHVGLGARRRGEFRIALAEGGYPLLTGELVQRLGAVTVPLLALILVVLLIGFAIEGG